MKNSILILCFCTLFLMNSCKNKNAKDNTSNPDKTAVETTDQYVATNDEANPQNELNSPERFVPDHESILGFWINDEKDFWIEFNEDRTYRMGKGAEIKSENLNWDISEGEKIIMIQTKTSEKKINYTFSNNELIIEKGKNNKKIILHKNAPLY